MRGLCVQCGRTWENDAPAICPTCGTPMVAQACSRPYHCPCGCGSHGTCLHDQPEITLAYINVGGITTVRNVGPEVTLLPGETLAVGMDTEERAEAIRVAMSEYPDMVLIESERGMTYLADQQRRHDDAVAAAAHQDAMARQWLREHEVPDYVVEYLQDQVRDDY